MRTLLIVILISLAAHIEAATTDLFGNKPDSTEKIIAALDKDLDKAFKGFLSDMDKEIKSAEKAGDVSLASRLQKLRESVLKERHFSDLHRAADSGSKPAAVKISSKWLKSEFNATKVAAKKDGSVVLYYDFSSSKEARDFTLLGDGSKVRRGLLELGPIASCSHNGKWDGNVQVTMEVAYANRKGNYLTIGNQTILGSTYNSWFIKIGSSQAKFASDYFNSGNLKDFRELSYTLTGNRALLTFGEFEGNPVTLGVMASPLRKGTVKVYGADGGAHIKSLVIKGTLNMDDYLE